MMEKTAKQLLEELTEAYARRDLIALEKKDAIPAEVKKVLDDIDEEFASKIELNANLISDLEAQVKKAVLDTGESVKGGALQAVFSKARVTWDSKQLDGLMIAVPELEQARKVGERTVSITGVSYHLIASFEMAHAARSAVCATKNKERKSDDLLTNRPARKK